MEIDLTKKSFKRDRENNGIEEDDDDKAKNRGNYRCSKCMLPKKGHICPYQQKIRRKELPGLDGTNCVDAEVQVEIVKDMTIRILNLNVQGFPESYMLNLPSRSR